MSFQEQLTAVLNSPASRVARAVHELNPETMEWDTTYTLVLNDPRSGGPRYVKIEAKTISMMRGKST